MKKRYLLVSSVLAYAAVTTALAFDSVNLSEGLTKKEDVFLEANQMDYFQEQGVVVARGKVEVQKGTNVIFADEINYNQNTGIVIAQGNVSYIGPDGNAIFTDYVELKDDLKAGVVNYFRARLDDGSLLAAAKAVRVNEQQTELEKAVYSPCPLCPENPLEPPQWQIKAEHVTVDQAAQQVRYEDAYLEVYGVPVLYSPYFSHPTPGADRKSGFLTPRFKTDANLGAALMVPYYLNIAENMEATLEPIITSKEGLVLAGGFKHLTEYGQYDFYGSITRPRSFTELADNSDNDKNLRGHIKGKGLFDVSQNWDFGFDGQFTSDDTYLRRYDYDNADLLTSRAYFERIQARNYTSLQAVHFKSLLEEDDNRTIPLAAPYFNSHFETVGSIIPGLTGSRVYVDMAGSSISRSLGSDSQRGSIEIGATAPLITTGGHVIESSVSVRADKFLLDGSDQQRVIPEASIGWRLPLASNYSDGSTQLLEPIVKLVVTPDVNYNKNIPNEDSQDVEFSELNVFDRNRYRGLDRVENGTRIYYGLRGGYYEDDYNVNYVIGQNYRLQKQGSAPTNSGIEDRLSDYVGRISAQYKDVAEVSYRFRMDENDFSARRNEVDVNLNYDPVTLNMSYFNLDYDFTNESDNREEISGNAKVMVTEQWGLLAGGTRNLEKDSNVNARAGIIYEGDCTILQATLRRDYYDDRDAKSGTSFDFGISLKNLGEI